MAQQPTLSVPRKLSKLFRAKLLAAGVNYKIPRRQPFGLFTVEVSSQASTKAFDVWLQLQLK